MNSIQRKIMSLSVIVLFIMATIWVVLTYYNQKTQEQYNEVLQRYMRMNEMTNLSQQTIASLNVYLLQPTPNTLDAFHVTTERILQANAEIAKLRTADNGFTLTNYMHMIESLVESENRSVMFHSQKNNELSNARFEEATRIHNYIAETTLSLIDKDLKTYDHFYRSIMKQSTELERLGVWLLTFITVTLLLFAYWFSRSMTRPIQKLTVAARELARGKFDMRIEVHSNDEISFLARTFDRMRININELISEIHRTAQLELELKESKLLLKESQLRSLQSQINPHFLFNTLDTISKKAYLEGSPETSDLIANVAGLLRYNLRRLDRSVTLREELNVVQKYIEIQQARFADRLRFVQQIDERWLDVHLPCLTLQPIIENAVIHAVEPLEEGGTIVFRILSEDGDTVRIEVEDSGAGMAPDQVHRMLEEQSQEGGSKQGHSTGIGFSNVVKRLRLFTGLEDVIEIDSGTQHGTKVTLKIPVDGRVAKHAEAVNRG
ncbi:sensor histidine kinase [Paenibacillus sp. MMS18-CY102]|uniref:sensor histidine kinase n=1 Tax=Paenibacillus sp. MMS18-CY102 TaxID=2682849 RepID=UPI001365EA2B|nr:sensor histidine kinase [Paenibacillus sp. MMS18-CY102]MWC28857.1 HAMP domain-containing protein [Paenibacillus sp. MMS18-CY102]